MGLRVTKTDDYAMRAMLHLACLPEGSTAMRLEIARALDSPSSFMAKVLRRLVHAKLLESTRGAHGGFSLARPTSEITFLEVLEAIEGPLHLVGQSSDESENAREAECPATAVWSLVEDGMRDILATTTLEDLVSARRRNGKVSWVPRTGAAALRAAISPERLAKCI
jgi:Rrf2 family protein